MIKSQIQQIQQILETLDILPQHWRLTPTMNKNPVGKNWNTDCFLPNQLKEELSSNGRIKIQSKYGGKLIVPNGIALVCGLNDQEFIIAADFDGIGGYKKLVQLATGASNDDLEGITSSELYRFALDLMPPTISYSSGTPHHAHRLFKTNKELGQSLMSLTFHIGKDKLELRGSGLGSTLPPSLHTSGRNYFFLNNCSPTDVDVAQAPDWIKRAMLRTISNNNYIYIDKNYSREDIENILGKINLKFADDYHSWIDVGKTLYALDSSFLNLWVDWSKKSPKFKEGECEYKWDTFANNNRRTVSTLHYYLKKS